MQKLLFLIPALLLVIHVNAFSDTLNVPADYPSIQAAIDAAADGDTVLVAPGTYFENINFFGKAITVTSKEGAASTVIDGNEAGRVVTFRSGEGPDSVLRGFSITNGRGYRGGGIICMSSSPTITDNIIHDNFSIKSGGGMYFTEGAAPIFYHNAVTGNETDYFGEGGALYCDRSSPIIIDSIFSENNAGEGGGGIFCTHSSPFLRDTVITDNWTYWNGKGGGIFCADGDPRLINCSFISNMSDSDGGGLHLQGGNASLIDCTFHDNYAGGGDGGGLGIQGGSARLIDCEFRENSASDISSSGGGMSNDHGSATLIGCSFIDNEHSGGCGMGAGVSNHDGELDLSDCVFEGNTIVYGCDGGGLANDGGTVKLTDCTFIRNSVVTALMSHDGGGIFSEDGSISAARCVFHKNEAGYYGGAIAGDCSSMAITDCVFIENKAYLGGGISSYNGDSNLTCCTLVKNEGFYQGFGGGIQCSASSSMTITNSILWDNQAGTGPEIMIGNAAGSSTLTITHSDLEGGQASVHVETGCTLDWGPGMIDSDPLFADWAGGDIHLTFISPCRGSGDNSAPGLSDFDFEGDPRIVQGTVDMGADEFHTHLYCTGDATPGGEVHGNLVGLPGTAPVSLIFGSGVLEPPVPSPWGYFHLQAPWLLSPLDPIPSNGILTLQATIPISSPAPHDLPMQAMIGLNPDSLTNLCVLEIRE
ncbi:MAG: hypothetical protein ACYTG7_14560 [Planctomycetota bacterium]|jgi:predicted outer membrane repeat protein